MFGRNYGWRKIVTGYLWIHWIEKSNAKSRIDFQTTFTKEFAPTRFQVLMDWYCLYNFVSNSLVAFLEALCAHFTWYPTDITLCLWSRCIYPRIRIFYKQIFSQSLFQREALKILYVKTRWWNFFQKTSSAGQKNSEEIASITWKTKPNLEICLFLKTSWWIVFRKVVENSSCYRPKANFKNFFEGIFFGTIVQFLDSTNSLATGVILMDPPETFASESPWRKTL